MPLLQSRRTQRAGICYPQMAVLHQMGNDQAPTRGKILCAHLSQAQLPPQMYLGMWSFAVTGAGQPASRTPAHG
eukprot:10602890-Heterocapsa_arctica.AAC.1